MKYVIDLIDDIRESIENEGEFVMGVVALEKELNADGYNTMAWAKALAEVKLFDDKKEFHCITGEKPLRIEDFLEATQNLSNEAMMYEVYVVVNNKKSELIGFSENQEQKSYMLLIEE